ncbi:MAG: ElyC/SanA/YdcF family protein, partial [bacterium]|nr:ElyC/SanA/YdcF family protein [bacterium]
MGISEQWLDKRSVEWLVLTSRVMSDEVVQADAAYLVGQTRDNASSVLERGAELWQKRLVTRLACQRGGDAAGYCGWDFSLRTLQILGVPPDAVVAVEARETKPNTLTELVSLALLAKQSGWVRILLVASPFHQLRSFITAVTAANREHPSLRIYNCVGLPLPWNERVIHSQGVL